ncbi:RAB11-binding protein RELCH homolog isoform X2 [Leptinotarsa decemlineata]|uniref:RAB11-binding protein RELCH homolog isoform X2 n=1 Tax=Leptinotarsa decemlineata TaxID=7539 RepID=UPI003D30C2A6
MSTFPETRQSCDENSKIVDKGVTYNDIATKLLQDRLLLTALELHTELLESGKEIRQLKDFFSNPGNFELQAQEFREIPSRLSRSGSQVTLDSLDLTRYSEDGGGTDERVAILEFELRKAKETINALRNNLTVATESETNSCDKDNSRNINIGGIKPHEQRALNFLINEYLLLHSYKLTSITFADENQNQDFDDWDDVGLNISKPPELLALYRDGLKQTVQNSASVSTQTDESDDQKAVENFGETIQNIELQTSNKSGNIVKLQGEIKQLCSNQKTPAIDSASTEIPYTNRTEIDKESTDSSDPPERFEFIDKNVYLEKKRDSIVTLEDNVSNNSFDTSDWTNLSLPIEIKESNSQTENKCRSLDRDLRLKCSKDPFLHEVYLACYIDMPEKQDPNIEEILKKNVIDDSFVRLVSMLLLKMIPNLILNKREEVIPLLVGSIHLNPKASERDKLLQQLFNLKKKPSTEERRMILSGLLSVAKYSGENLVENEILPQCWLQLTHKHVERRLLVAEACIILIPFLSEPIRNSLCLSMLQQMLEDKEDAVRETVIKALALLVALCDDKDKYCQCEQLALSTLNDSSNSVVNTSTQILFPVLGKWALEEGLLINSLMKKLLNTLSYHVKNTESTSKVNLSSDKILRMINVIDNLLTFLMMSVACYESIICNIEKDMAMELRYDFKNVCSCLTNPEFFSRSEISSGVVLYEFDKYINDNPNISWPELDWIIDVMLPDIFNNLHYIETSQQQLLQSFINFFSHFCIVFGSSFSKFKIRPILHNKIQSLEQVMSSFNQFNPSLNIIPVYLTVLSYSGEYDELSNVLKNLICALPLCGSPLDCLEITVKRLCVAGLQEVVVDCLWAGITHQRPLVRAASATLISGIIGLCSRELLRTKVTAALVTLATDNDVLVRTAAIPALGTLISDCSIADIHDKVYMQLQSFISDPNLKENHALLRQLIVTLGTIAINCSLPFRYDVIFPQLSSYSSYMSQMKNQTRKIDMALALVEAYKNIIYSPLNEPSTTNVLLSGLRHLEAVILENQVLNVHWETIVSMMKECENRVNLPTECSPKMNQNVNHSVEDVRQRVSKIFNKPIPKATTLPNLQGIFRKK